MSGNHDCPVCGATPGQRCDAGTIPAPHPERAAADERYARDRYGLTPEQAQRPYGDAP